MAGVRAVIGLALSAAVGIMFLVLGSAPLPMFDHGYWWPLFVLFFYILCPIPIVVSRRFTESMDATSACYELSIFLTSGTVVSAFGLLIVLAHADVITWSACGFCLVGNLIVFGTILAYFLLFSGEDFDYSPW